MKIHEGLSYESRVCNSALVETFGENVAGARPQL